MNTSTLNTTGNPLKNNPLNIYNGLMAGVDPDKAEQYKQFAEYFFNNVDVNECKVKNNTLPPDQQLVLYAMEGLKSGLHPNSLSSDEIQALYDTVGDVWISKFGFTKEEVPPPPVVRDTPPLFVDGDKVPIENAPPAGNPPTKKKLLTGSEKRKLKREN